MTDTDNQRAADTERILTAFNKHFERCLSFTKTNCTAVQIKEVLQECKEYGEYIAEEDMVNVLKEWHYPYDDWSPTSLKKVSLTPKGGKGKWKEHYLIRRKWNVYPIQQVCAKCNY